MDSKEAFMMMEKQILDCPHAKLRVFTIGGDEIDIIDVHESQWEMHIVVRI